MFLQEKALEKEIAQLDKQIRNVELQKEELDKTEGPLLSALLSEIKEKLVDVRAVHKSVKRMEEELLQWSLYRYEITGSIIMDGENKPHLRE
ncbi:unnamed protein product [Nippostrongylus brasiliensis]|uniref:Uncharacterized protein n=1 Tax=Nippostrongylus brasiliensis TaxID=27835 RepID=A0A3P7BJA1_NIPBR|nr:unnamed protein product [Nippostrongylus brasiliensis]